jgi:hypothetical protein
MTGQIIDIAILPKIALENPGKRGDEARLGEQNERKPITKCRDRFHVPGK